jgi:hypothetical protein
MSDGAGARTCTVWWYADTAALAAAYVACPGEGMRAAMELMSTTWPLRRVNMLGSIACSTPAHPRQVRVRNSHVAITVRRGWMNQHII